MELYTTYNVLSHNAFYLQREQGQDTVARSYDVTVGQILGPECVFWPRCVKLGALLFFAGSSARTLQAVVVKVVLGTSVSLGVFFYCACL